MIQKKICYIWCVFVLIISSYRTDVRLFVPQLFNFDPTRIKCFVLFLFVFLFNNPMWIKIQFSWRDYRFLNHFNQFFKSFAIVRSVLLVLLVLRDFCVCLCLLVVDINPLILVMQLCLLSNLKFTSWNYYL